VLLAVDHPVGPVADGRELIRELGVDAGPVAAVGSQPDAHGGQELGVGDVLLLGDDHAASDLKAGLGGQGTGEAQDDPVVLAREQSLDTGELSVVVGPHVTGHVGVLGIALEKP
jgi:hypothetical protein